MTWRTSRDVHLKMVKAAIVVKNARQQYRYPTSLNSSHMLKLLQNVNLLTVYQLPQCYPVNMCFIILLCPVTYQV